MKIPTLALIATATVAATTAVPPSAHADDSYQFQSPSGNILCMMARDGENYDQAYGKLQSACQVQRHTYAVPPPQYVARNGSPAVCHLGGWGSQFSLVEGDPPRLDCVGGVLVDPPPPALDYGQTRSLGPITCDSEPSGVTCTDSGTGHFFRVSQDSYQLD